MLQCGLGCLPDTYRYLTTTNSLRILDKRIEQVAEVELSREGEGGGGVRVARASQKEIRLLESKGEAPNSRKAKPPPSSGPRFENLTPIEPKEKEKEGVPARRKTCFRPAGGGALLFSTGAGWVTGGRSRQWAGA